MRPIRLQLSRAGGFSLQNVSRAANGLAAVNVARPGKWGNPWRVGETIDMRQANRWGWTISSQGRKRVCANRAEAVRAFRHCLAMDVAYHPAVIDALGGRNLACWCGPDSPCHADALLELANGFATGKTPTGQDLSP